MNKINNPNLISVIAITQIEWLRTPYLIHVPFYVFVREGASTTMKTTLMAET